MVVTGGIDADKELAVGFFSEPDPQRYSVKSAFDLDFGVITRPFLDGLSHAGQQTGLGGGRLLLPPDYVWTKDGRTQAPMALCEFVAYKAALSYEDEPTVKAAVGHAPHVEWFDSSKDKDRLADTQGFAFVHDGMAFIIMRGSEKKGADWTTNLQHQLTDELLTPRREKLVKELTKRHGARVATLLDGLAAKPGRHLGFAIGWAAVHDKIVAHLEKHCLPGMPVVLSGHSLGGALALIGALELQRAGREIAAVITFGAPQAGTKAFKREYEAAGLAARTVLFEAQGDSVPRLLRRWYYRMGSGLRSRVVGLLTPGTATIPHAEYDQAGNPWTFVARPALSAQEVKDSVDLIKKADQERKAKEEQERKAREQAATGSTAAGGTEAAPASPTASQAPAPAQPTPAQATGGTPAQGAGGTPAQGTGQGSGGAMAAWIIGGILVLVLVLIVWLFVRSKLAAHAIIDRYALFLSTLSYQRIRALRAPDPGTTGDRLKLANDDLSRYLQFIRGEGAHIAKAKATDLPVRLEADLDLATFLSEPKNII
jgi:hypothetical protein